MPASARLRHPQPPALAVLLVGLAGAAPAWGQQTLVDSSVQAMAQVDGSRQVWWSSTLGCPGGEFPTTCNIFRAWSTHRTSFPDSAFANRAGPRDQDLASNIALNQSEVMWVSVGGQILENPRWGSTAPPTVVSTKVDPATWSEIAADDAYVYWTENVGSASGRLYRAPRAGGPPEQMASNPRGSLRDLRADGAGGVLYRTTNPVAIVCCVDIVERVYPSGGGFAIDRSRQQSVDAFDVFGDEVFYITRAGTRGRVELRSAPLADLSRSRALLTLDATNAPRWPALEVDADNVYWQQFFPTTGQGPIFRWPRGGGAPAPIGSNQSQVQAFAAIGDNLLMLVEEQIRRIEVNAASQALDLAGDEVGLEVVQVIQSAAHDVPLIEGKKTFVRAYGRIRSSATGRTFLSVRPAAVLHGTRDGAPLPGSPLRPVRSPAFTDRVPERTDLDSTFLFELPREWTHGTVTLRSELDPNRLVPDPDRSNNGASRTAIFEASQGLCVDLVLVQTQAGVSRPGVTFSLGARLGRVMEHFSRATTLLPVDRVVPAFNGGPPRVRPLIQDPYDMRNGLHKSQLMMNLSVEFTLSDPPRACGGRRAVRAAMVPDSDKLGLSYGGGPYIYFLESFTGGPVNYPWGGVSGLAHELGHQLGRPHILCPVSGPGAPANPDGAYPYDTCRIDDANDHIGLDPISGQLIVPILADGSSGARDFMSYGGRPYWTSDYTYEAIFDQLRVGAASRAAPVGGSGASAGGAGPSLVVGILAGRDSELGFAYEAPVPAVAAAAIAEKSVPFLGYALDSYDANGNLLDSVPLTGGRIEAEDGSNALLFTNLVPSLAQVARLEVVDSQQNLLASRSAGVAPPQLAILGPVAGDTVAGVMNVVWSALDPDGDDLRYQVRYSADDGATWISLGSDLAATSLPVDMDALPGGPLSLIEVAASDGLHTSIVRAGPFTTPERAPEVAILTRDGAVLGPNDTTTVPQGAPLALEGFGYGAAEGLLPDAALSWQVTGPSTRAGFGRELVLDGLPPGRYTVELSAFDERQRVGRSTTGLLVAPKQIARAAAPDLDGRCDDDAYGDDAEPIALRYADGAPLVGRAVVSGGDLYVCVGGLRRHSGADEQVDLRIDPTGLGATGLSGSDRIYTVGLGGRVETGRGSPNGVMVPDPAPDGLEAAVTGDDAGWSAELVVDLATLAPSGRVIALALSHEWTGPQASGSIAWPAGALGGAPSTWGQAKLPAPPDPLQMLDALERKVRALGLRRPLERRLLRKLAFAERMVQRQRTFLARLSLVAFEHMVRSRCRGGLTPAQIRELVADARAIRVALRP